MPTLLEEYRREKEAGAGKPASASEHNLYSNAGKNGTLLYEYRQQEQKQRNRYALAAIDNDLKEDFQNKMKAAFAQPNLYAQAQNAAKGTSALLGSVYDKAEDRQSGLHSGAYADILKRQDYAEKSAAGESKIRGFGFGNDELYDYINNIGNERERADMAQLRGMGAKDYGKYAFMTDDEVGIYNYLYATEGKKAAGAFLDELEPELDKQWYSGAKRNTQDWVGQNAATKILGSAATVLAQPARTITGGLALAEDAIRTKQGKEVNPYSGLRQMSRMAQDVREKVSEDMSGTGSFVYNTVMSAADSAVNSMIAGGLGQGLEAAGLAKDAMEATNFLGSALMSNEVASMGVAEAKEKGYSNEGALALGLIRGGIEYASEAIGGDWAIRRIRQNPMGFLNAMVRSAVPEGVEEVMSDAGNEIVNLIMDDIFSTDESMIRQYLQYYRENGSKNPGLDTLWAVLQNEALSFAGGALSAVGTGAVQFHNYKTTVGRVCQQLHTDAETVHQLMEEANTDNPAVLGVMAEIGGIESVEGFRAKLAESRAAQESVDAAMRGENKTAAQGQTAAETSSDSNAKVLAVESAFIGSNANKGPTDAVLNTADTAPQVTSETPQQTGEAFVTNNVAQPEQTVNGIKADNTSAEDLSQNENAEDSKTNSRSLDGLRKELREAEQAYQDADARGDLDYDYVGELARIKELREKITQARSAGETGGSLADAQDDNESARSENENAQPKTVKVGNYEIIDTHPERGPLDEKTGVRTVKAEDLTAELEDIGVARVENDTGDYRCEIKKKKDGRLLATVDRNGKRDISKSFKDFREAAHWLSGYVTAQTEARADAELDRHKSEKKRPAGITEALLGQTDPQKEADKRLYNSAAEAATKTLRDRIRRTNEEIQALNRLERTTGLTDQQKAHREDLQKTLDVMNDELTSRKNKTAEERKAAAERREAEKVKVTGNKPTRSAADARRSLMELFNTPEGSRHDVGEKIQMKLNEIQESGKLTEESRQELFDLLMDEGVVPKQAEPTLRQIREDLNGTRIYVSERDRADFGDGWKELYRRAWGARIFLTNDPADAKVDTVNREMADAYGASAFPTDAALSDMLGNLIEKAERGKTTNQALKDAIADEAYYTGTTEDEIYGDMFKRMTSTLETFAQKAGLEVELKDKSASQLATERKRWMERQEAAAQRRRESEIQKKVLKGLQRLEKLKDKAAPEVRAQVDEILKDIDTQARYITPSGIEDLKALQRVYEEKARQEGYVDDDNPGNFLRNPYVEEKLKRLSDKHLGEMDINDVIELGRVVAGIENAIRTQNKIIGEEQDATIKEYANGVDKEVWDAKGARPGFWQKWFKEEQLSPRRFLEMLGGWKDGYMKKLSLALENGQTRQLDFQRRAMQSFDAFLSREENRKWLETASGKKAKWSTYGVVNGLAMDGSGLAGQAIEITPMMRVSLYLHSQNEDNLRHIQTGGLVIPNKSLYEQGKILEAYAQGDHVKMQPEAVRAIAGQLTQEEKTFAGYLQKFFNETSKQAINEVSMQLDGFERAAVEQYFPIESSRDYLASDVAGEARAQTVEGIGSIANERVHAGNPIVLSDASEVLLRQIDKVSRYYGYAIPIRNFQAVNNYVFHEEGNAFAGSIKETVNRKWGSGAEKYITKMLADLQSGGKGSDMMGSVLAKLRGNLAGATLMANPSVAISQTASYPGAAQVVGWDGLAHGLAAGKVDTKLIDKYTPLYWYRNQGNSTQELGDSLKQKGLEQKLPWLLNWIQKMDSATVRRIWAAAEYRVSKDNPRLKPGSQEQINAGTDPYYQKVAEVFNRAVYDTQPNYTTMERAQILRSDSDVTKFLTMYKTVPLQYYGMMTEAAGRLQAAKKSGNKAQIEKAQKYAADTYGGLLAANMVYVAMKALFKGIRGKDDDYKDEEGNLTAASVSKQLSKELIEVYAGSVIGGAEALSIGQSLYKGSRFRGPEMSALTHVEDVVNGVVSIRNAVETQDPRKAAGAVKDASENVAMAFGLPVKNVETYTMAMVRRFFPEAAMEYENIFGGIERSDMKRMDSEVVNTASNIILRNRTGQSLDRSVTNELGRLYAAGFTDAIPTSIPESFKYGDNVVQIKDRRSYSETWGNIVGNNIEELLGSSEYAAVSDKEKKSMIDKLYDYATVKARQQADPDYTVTGNSTYGWTEKADECVAAGIDLTDAICVISAIGNMHADKDASGNSISGSKKTKVVEFINGLDLTDEQKDALYLTVGGYKENTLDGTPWHGGSGGKKRSGRSSGGGRGKSRAASVKPVGVITAGKKSSVASGIDIRDLLGGSTQSKNADAGAALVEIIDKYYGGNALAAAMDGGRKAKGRSKVDFRAKV